jgi:phosphoglycolate phosphatase-like HAD superfamily hydrolase
MNIHMGHAPVRLRRSLRTALALCVVLFGVAGAQAQRDPLPSWNSGPAKQAILSFVKDTTDKSSAKYVEPKDRIATFDQDGTLWTEHPLYAQAMFALDRVGQLAPQHPEWKEKQPFKAVIEGDQAAMSKFSESDWLQVLAVTHTGMSTEAFQEIVKQWLATARAPRFDRPYTDLIYQPMLEVMKYLRDKGFKTYIVTGGGQEFVRVYSEQVYGVPPEQVVGSSIVTKYEDTNGKPVLMREPKVFLIDDGPGKAVGINLFIGKRPHAAFGNSGNSAGTSGDAQMLEWTQVGDGARLMMLVHHDDAKREYAYGPGGGLPDTHVGTFSDALMAEANKSGWIVISMKNDWKRIFAFDK